MLGQTSIRYWESAGYNTSALDRVFKESPHYLRLVRLTWDGSGALIANTTPLVDERHYDALITWLHMAFRAYPPNAKGSFLISLHDAVWEQVSTEVPILGFGKDRSDCNTVLVPDFDFMFTGGYAEHREALATLHSELPWDKRLQTAFWRGSTTGLPAIAPETWKDNLRVRLCLLSTSQQRQTLLNAALSEITQCETATTADEIRSAGLLQPILPYPNFCRFRYLIDIDGNSCSWSLFWKLMSGSLVLKVSGMHEQWYYSRLVPHEHYLPVKADLSDLFQVIAWAIEHDKEAAAIAENARNLTAALSYDNCLREFSQTVEALLRSGTGEDTVLRAVQAPASSSAT